MKKVRTIDGVFSIAGSSKTVGLVFIDLIFSTVTLSFVIEVLKLLTLDIPLWSAAVFGILVFLYPLLAYRDVVKSIGRWSRGVKCYPYSKIEGYTGKGALFVVDEVPKKVLSKRVIIVVAYFGIMFSLMTVMQDYSG